MNARTPPTGPQGRSYVAFAGVRCVAAGAAAQVLPELKRRFDADRGDTVLVFDVESGRQVDFDLGGSLDEVLQRVAASPNRGPGRPKLGVTSRELSLLPRHWEWLEEQSSGVSGAVRRLVEHALRDEPGAQRAGRIRAALSRFLSAIAGDRPNFEETTRALFQGDTDRVAELIQRWPKDVREHAMQRMNEAAACETSAPDAKTLVAALHELVWSRGDYDAIERLVAPQYRIHSDPGDAWEGRTLDHATYRERVEFSRAAFADLAFQIEESLAEGERVSVRWRAEGQQVGDLPGLPATGKHVTFRGQTIYAIRDNQVAGHWQVVDRLGFVQSLR